MKRDKRVN